MLKKAKMVRLNGQNCQNTQPKPQKMLFLSLFLLFTRLFIAMLPKFFDRITRQAKEQAKYPLTHEHTLYNPKNECFT